MLIDIYATSGVTYRGHRYIENIQLLNAGLLLLTAPKAVNHHSERSSSIISFHRQDPMLRRTRVVPPRA
jgi:hypothetical protein